MVSVTSMARLALIRTVAGEDSTWMVVSAMATKPTATAAALRMRPTGPKALESSPAKTCLATHAPSFSRPFFRMMPSAALASANTTFLTLVRAAAVADPPPTTGMPMAMAAAVRSRSLTMSLKVLVEVTILPATMKMPGMPYCHRPVRSAPDVETSSSQSEVPRLPNSSSTAAAPSRSKSSRVGSVGMGMPRTALVAEMDQSFLTPLIGVPASSSRR